MKYRLKTGWTEEMFQQKKRWVIKFTDHVYFTYHWNEHHQQYQANVFLKVQNANGDFICAANSDFRSIDNDFEEWFIQSLIPFFNLCQEAQNEIVKWVSVAGVFDKDRKVMPNPEHPERLTIKGELK